MMNEWILSSTVLIAAVLLGRLLLRGRISLRLQYALWAVVLVRLLLPIQVFTSDFGTGSMAREVDISAPVRQVYVSPERYEREYDEAYQKVVAEYEAANRHADPVVIEKTAQTMAETTLELDFRNILRHIWFAGMVVMTSVIVSCNVHLSLQLKRRRWALEVPESLLPVYVTEAVPTPCVFGLFRPAIYLTPDAAKDPQVRAHVLEHELTHYRHFDHVWSVLRSVCLVLHWYNPLVWIAAKVSRADAELACDEGALARLGESQRSDYGRTLIGLTCSAPISDLLITATTMTGSAGSIRERIRLLMKRPRNTVLTVTAVILMVTLIVGCTFAGAPETTEPATEPGVDNDMSYQGEDMPIPDDPAAPILYADGVLVYPGTEWFMTEAEVLAALGLTHRDVLDAQHINDNGMKSSCFTVNHSDAFDVPMVLYFTFRSYWSDSEPVLTEVYGRFLYEADFETVRSLYAQSLGETDCKINPGIEERWDSDILLRDLVGRDGYEILDRCAGHALNVPASYVQWLNNGTPEIVWRTELPEPGAPEWSGDQAAEVAALFGEGADPWYLAALRIPYQNWYYVDALTFFGSNPAAVALTKEEQAVITEAYGRDALEKSIFRMTSEQMDQIVKTYLGTADLWCLNLSDFLFCPETDAYLAVMEETPQLHSPEILSLEQLDENQVRMIYRFPGEGQRYCATLLKGANWKVYSNPLLINKPPHARYLTEEEIAQVNAAYDHDDVSGFFNCLFSDPTEVDLEEFLRYYPSFSEATQEEWDLLREKYGEDLFFYEVAQLRDMPVPVHRYEIDHIDQVFRRYTGIGYEDIIQKDTLYHLDQSRCYYNGTSDANPGLFICRNGWVYDGGATLFSRDSALVLKEINGTYYIQAHMPALIAE